MHIHLVSAPKQGLEPAETFQHYFCSQDNTSIMKRFVPSFLVVLLSLTLACKSQGNDKKITTEPTKTISMNSDTITLGGGCFWCVEAIYQQLIGVEKVVSGYAGGTVQNPTYEQVCTGTTGHAEVVQIIFNPDSISLEEILHVFFSVHDPTTLNQQGADIGTQYRSVIFTRNEQQVEVANQVINELKSSYAFPRPIVTVVEPFTSFYSAEDYHQNYYNQNKNQGYCRAVIAPKLEKFQKTWKEKIRH